ncbi:hypothetical protein HZA42_01825 [Candidatus Peregrinibacteria bacterium]|nr:hypothetical protein [Candidatus Peregrinibacteria bacterium]
MEKRKIKKWVIVLLMTLSVAGGLAVFLNSNTKLFKGTAGGSTSTPLSVAISTNFSSTHDPYHMPKDKVDQNIVSFSLTNTNTEAIPVSKIKLYFSPSTLAHDLVKDVKLFNGLTATAPSIGNPVQITKDPTVTDPNKPVFYAEWTAESNELDLTIPANGTVNILVKASADSAAVIDDFFHFDIKDDSIIAKDGTQATLQGNQSSIIAVTFNITESALKKLCLLMKSQDTDATWDATANTCMLNSTKYTQFDTLLTAIKNNSALLAKMMQGLIQTTLPKTVSLLTNASDATPVELKQGAIDVPVGSFGILNNTDSPVEISAINAVYYWWDSYNTILPFGKITNLTLYDSTAATDTKISGSVELQRSTIRNPQTSTFPPPFSMWKKDENNLVLKMEPGKLHKITIKASIGSDAPPNTSFHFILNDKSVVTSDSTISVGLTPDTLQQITTKTFKVVAAAAGGTDSQKLTVTADPGYVKADPPAEIEPGKKDVIVASFTVDNKTDSERIPHFKLFYNVARTDSLKIDSIKNIKLSINNTEFESESTIAEEADTNGNIYSAGWRNVPLQKGTEAKFTIKADIDKTDKTAETGKNIGFLLTNKSFDISNAITTPIMMKEYKTVTLHLNCTAAGGEWLAGPPEACKLPNGEIAHDIAELAKLLAESRAAQNIIEISPDPDFKPATDPRTISPGEEDFEVASFIANNTTAKRITIQQVKVTYANDSTLDADELVNFKLFANDDPIPAPNAPLQLTEEASSTYAKWEKGTNLKLKIAPGKQKITVKTSLKKDEAAIGKTFKFYITEDFMTGDAADIKINLLTDGTPINMPNFKVVKPPADGQPAKLTVSTADSTPGDGQTHNSADGAFTATELKLVSTGEVQFKTVTVSMKAGLTNPLPWGKIESIQLFDENNDAKSAPGTFGEGGKATLTTSWKFAGTETHKLRIKVKLAGDATPNTQFALGINKINDIELVTGKVDATAPNTFPVFGNNMVVKSGTETDAEKAAREAAAAEAARQAAAAEAARQAAATAAQAAALQSQINQLQQQLEQARASGSNLSSAQLNALNGQIALLASQINNQQSKQPAKTTCEDLGQYTYTGPARPGIRMPGMCIDCPTTVYVKNGGQCEVVKAAAPAAKPASKTSAKTGSDKTAGVSIPEALQASSLQIQIDQLKQELAQAKTAQNGGNQAAGTGQSAAGQPASGQSANSQRSAATEPNLTGSQRLVRAPERSGTGPEVLVYFGILAIAQGAIIIRRKWKKEK